MITRYPRNRIASVSLRSELHDGYRIMPARHVGNPLGTTPADSRFCSRSSGYTVLYASPDFATAFIETVVRDRFTHRRDRPVALKEVTKRAWAHISTRSEAELMLLDLRRDGCTRIGAPTDTVRAKNHAAGRAFARAIHAEHPDIDGLVYMSRLTEEEVYAVFDRGMDKLEATGARPLAEHPDLPDVLRRHGIQLVQ